MRDFANIKLNFSQIKTIVKEDVNIDHLMGVHSVQRNEMDSPASIREVINAMVEYFESIGITPCSLNDIAEEERGTLKNGGRLDEYTERFRLYGLSVTVDVVLLFKSDGTPVIGLRATRNI